MARLDLEAAPATGLPRGFLTLVPAWGLVAGLILLVSGPDALVSRWGPSTLALVHSVTLGMLGNAMFGSLLQFLPAAAGVRPCLGEREVRVMRAALNAGAALLVGGFLRPHPWLSVGAMACLGVAFVLLILGCLPPLCRAGLKRLPHGGIAAALVSAGVAACLGAGLLLGRMGTPIGLPTQPWVDVHALWGLLGWVLVLLASVGQVVVPMFQAVDAPDARVLASWVATVMGGLVLATVGAVSGYSVPPVLVLVLAVPAYATAALASHIRRRHRRNPALTRAWRAGLGALIIAPLALALAAGTPHVAVGVMGIALGLLLPVLAMQLEIVAFLAWIAMHRASGRGVRIPGVDRLLPERRKARALATYGAAAIVVAAAAVVPSTFATRGAAVLLIAAACLHVHAIRGIARRARPYLTPTRQPA